MQPPSRRFASSIGIKFVEIRPGSFMMGAPPCEPDRDARATLHKVTLTKGFLMSATLVTVRDFRTFVSDSGYVQSGRKKPESKGKQSSQRWQMCSFKEDDNHPVVGVNWDDAVAFCSWIGRKENAHCRLPTEAEWEYCCRAGTQTTFPWGDNPDDGNGWANCSKEIHPLGHNPSFTKFNWWGGYEFTSPVASFRANAWGLYDMIGNVWEWCNDLFDDDYPPGEVVDPQGPPKGNIRIVRGGSWQDGPRYCRCAYRGIQEHWNSNNATGFRLAMDLAVTGSPSS